MEHKYQDNIKCPHCDWEDQDSWEFESESGEMDCGNCGEEFFVEKHIEVTFSTSRINCEESNNEHEYLFHEYHVSKRKYENSLWVDIPEHEWQYFKIMRCSICGQSDYIEITKEEFNIQSTKP